MQGVRRKSLGTALRRVHVRELQTLLPQTDEAREAGSEDSLSLDLDLWHQHQGIHIQTFSLNFSFIISRSDKNLNSRVAKDSQGLVRTCQVLDQSLHVPFLALQVLDQSLPVLGNPGDTLTTLSLLFVICTPSGNKLMNYSVIHSLSSSSMFSCFETASFKNVLKQHRKKMFKKQCVEKTQTSRERPKSAP